MKNHKWMAMILVLSLAFNIKASIDIASMKNQITNLSNSIHWMEDSFNNNVSNSIWRMEEAIKKETSLVSEFKLDFIELNNKMASFFITLKPRIINKDDKVYFLLKTDKEDAKLIVAETEDSIIYTAMVDISVFESADIDLVIESADTKKTEKLDYLYPAIEKFTADIAAHPVGGNMKYIKDKEYLFINYDYGMTYHLPYYEAIGLKDVNLNIEVNNKVVDRIAVPKEQKGNYQYYISLKEYKIPCKIGDDIYFYITAEDNNGFNYKASMEAWTIGEYGEVNYNPDLINYENMVDIY